MSVLVVAWGSLAARATPIVPTPSTTVVTTQAAATTTTGAGGQTTTTLARAPATTARPASTSTSAVTVAAPPTTFPPALVAIANSVRRSPPNSTQALLTALAPLENLGYTAEQAALVGMGQFPVGGPAFYTDDWLELRPGNPPKLHYGVDIVAALATPLRAPIDGVLSYDYADPTGYGLEAIVTGPDKTFYRLAHMSATVKGLTSGATVTLGQVIGFIGQSGDASGPHCHFEVHPRGGAGVDPKPVLDAWLAAAIAAAPALIAAVKAPAVAETPIAVALPLPQVDFSAPREVLSPHPKLPPETPIGLALVALLALLATAGVAVVRYRPVRASLDD